MNDKKNPTWTDTKNKKNTPKTNEEHSKVNPGGPINNMDAPKAAKDNISGSNAKPKVQDKKKK